MLEELLDELERTLDPGPWIVGADYSLAEITIAPYMFRLSALGADQFWSHNRRPRVNDWYKRISARPAFLTAVSWPDESGGGYEEVGLKASRAGLSGLPQRRRDVAAVDGGDIAGGFQLQRLVQKGLRHVLGGDFAAEQVAAHVVLLGDAARLGALP